jgi:hypothetical protein
MSLGKEFSPFSNEEIKEQDNCVFFAAYQYVEDQFGIQLKRADFERFLQRKKTVDSGSGIEIPSIPYVLDFLLKPYGVKVSSILMQKGAKEYYYKQLKKQDWFFRLRAMRFLLDRRIISTNTWSFPFIAYLVAHGEIDHIEYVPDKEEYTNVINKVGGDEGRIPMSYKLARVKKK